MPLSHSQIRATVLASLRRYMSQAGARARLEREGIRARYNPWSRTALLEPMCERFGIRYDDQREVYDYEENLSFCEQCESTLTADLTTAYTRTPTGRRNRISICESCGDSFASCENCGELWAHDHLIFSERSDSHYCEDCWEGDDEDNPLPDYHSGYRPPNPPKTEPAYSLELEIEAHSSDHRASITEKLDSLRYNSGHSIGYERDGSLDDETGMEILVSCYPSATDLASALDRVLDVASARAVSWRASNSCGAHLNSNKWVRWCGQNNRIGIGWTVPRVARLLHMVRGCWDILKKIAGRETHYAQLPPTKLKLWAKGDCDKYVAVRIQRDRMEWRIFKGSLHGPRLAMYLRTVEIMEEIALSDMPSRLIVKSANYNLSELYAVYKAKNDAKALGDTVSALATLREEGK